MRALDSTIKQQQSGLRSLSIFHQARFVGSQVQVTAIFIAAANASKTSHNK